MCVIPVMLCLLVLKFDEGRATKTSMVSETEARMIFRNELNKVAYDFQENLRDKITSLEMDMSSKFVEFMSEITESQDTASESLRRELSEKVADMLEKLNKVVTYSTLKIQDLGDQLSKVLTSLGTWTEDLDSAVIFSHDEYLKATLYNSEFADSDRSRRHTLDWMPRDPPHNYAETISNSDPLVVPLVQEVGLDAFLDYINVESGHVRDDSTPFVLRQYAHVWDTQTALPTSHHTTKDVTKIPMDCLDLLTDGHTQDGVYKIYPAGVGVEVWCEQSSAGGGWTVVGGRRVAHQVNFTRPTFHYTRGFGDPAANHWIGVEVMHALTRHAPNTLRVHLVDHLQQSANATYSNFSVGGPEDQYRLQVEGYDPSSTAGDALTPHSGAPFSSPLHLSGNNCSNELGVGWWFMDAPDCYLALPTGHYHTPGHYQGTGGVEWRPWRGAGYSLHTFLLMTRRHTV